MLVSLCHVRFESLRGNPVVQHERTPSAATTERPTLGADQNEVRLPTLVVFQNFNGLAEAWRSTEHGV